MTALPAESPPGAQQARACLVALAGHRFAVEVRYAREVVVFDEVTIVPLALPQLRGVVNLRGSVMPLVDVRPLAGLEPARATPEARALVVECDGTQAAMLIDEVLGLEPLEGVIPIGERDGGPYHVSAGYLEREGGAVTLLDVRRMLDAVGGEARSAEGVH
jgi:purine-binding chemotaxis protein CheW